MVSLLIPTINRSIGMGAMASWMTKDMEGKHKRPGRDKKNLLGHMRINKRWNAAALWSYWDHHRLIDSLFSTEESLVNNSICKREKTLLWSPDKQLVDQIE